MDWSLPTGFPAAVLDDRGLIKNRSHFAKVYFNDHDVRVHADWNFLAGACGYTYGNNAVWQMYRPGQDIGSTDRSFALLYLPQGKPVSVALGQTAGDEVVVRWYDPRTGDYAAPQRRANAGIARFAPPDEGADRDWLLVLEAK
jgi:hypothetical protein